jgi:DNA-binding transcriptional regulator YiaG
VAKVNRTYRVIATPARDGFTASYTVPGLEGPRFVMDRGQPLVVPNDVDALAEAGVNLCEFMNERTRSRRKFGYTRLGGAELAIALRDLGLTPSEFAILYGSNLQRVMQWMDGEDDVPHQVRVMLALFTLPGAIGLARQITSAATYDRRDAAE